MITLRCSYQKIWNVEHPHYDIIQHHFAEIWFVNLCRTAMSQYWSKCSITPLFFQSFIRKGGFHDCVWYDEHLGRICQKWKKFYHVSYFSLYINLPQRVSFSHARTHLCNDVIAMICLTYLFYCISVHPYFSYSIKKDVKQGVYVVNLKSKFCIEEKCHLVPILHNAVIPEASCNDIQIELPGMMNLNCQFKLHCICVVLHCFLSLHQLLHCSTTTKLINFNLRCSTMWKWLIS